MTRTVASFGTLGEGNNAEKMKSGLPNCCGAAFQAAEAGWKACTTN